MCEFNIDIQRERERERDRDRDRDRANHQLPHPSAPIFSQPLTQVTKIKIKGKEKKSMARDISVPLHIFDFKGVVKLYGIPRSNRLSISPFLALSMLNCLLPDLLLSTLFLGPINVSQNQQEKKKKYVKKYYSRPFPNSLSLDINFLRGEII